MMVVFIHWIIKEVFDVCQWGHLLHIHFNGVCAGELPDRLCPCFVRIKAIRNLNSRKNCGQTSRTFSLSCFVTMLT